VRITSALAIWFGLSKNGFASMVIFTTPGFWTFMALVAAAVFVLRCEIPRRNVLIACRVIQLLRSSSTVLCWWMVYSSVRFAIENRSWEAIWSIAILLVGVAMSFYKPGSTPAGQSDCKDCSE